MVFPRLQSGYTSRHIELWCTMESLLFSARSDWTMIHGIVLGGGALLGLAAALFSLVTIRAANTADTVDGTAENQARYLGAMLVLVALALWIAVVIGTYVIFPDYRATPPIGLTDLGQYPKSIIQANPATAWLHSFAMEIKEQIPWIAAILATAVAFVSVKYRSRLLHDAPLRRLTTWLLAMCFVMVAGVSLLGVLINKVAPLE